MLNQSEIAKYFDQCQTNSEIEEVLSAYIVWYVHLVVSHHTTFVVLLMVSIGNSIEEIALPESS